MPMTYRKPTASEKAKMEKAREMTRKGIEGESDLLSKISTTAAKSARDEIKEGHKMMEEVPEKAREYEAYQEAGYKKGGLVTSRGQGKVMRTKKTRIC